MVFLILAVSPARSQDSLWDSVFHPDSLQRLINLLAADSLNGRLAGSDGAVAAAGFIADEFRQAGLVALNRSNDFLLPINPSWFNVAGMIKGRSRPGQVVIFMAHYDHIGTVGTNPFPDLSKDDNRVPVSEDDIFNGANDNASGVAALIGLARYYHSLTGNERSLIFLAVTGSEFGPWGSEHFVDHFQNDSICAVINMDMIGSFTPLSKPFFTDGYSRELQTILNKNLYNADPVKYGRQYFLYNSKAEIDTKRLTPLQKNFLAGKDFKGVDAWINSRNQCQNVNAKSFARNHVPVVSISSTYVNDKYYHHVKDEPFRIDYTMMGEVIRAIVTGTAGIISGQNTPDHKLVSKTDRY